MSLMGQKNSLECMEDFERRLDGLFEKKRIQGKESYVTKGGVFFSVFAYDSRNAIGLEYAEDEKAAAKGQFEDGDLFYLEDFETEEALQVAMLSEINEQ